ncbi:MAG: diadenylate cyclase CdaA [Streptococcaceae bacterium]|jgi:diadenylate cyclase|nr:diadenylate cyclase CdaA [Streptococcaceae bacterium]
MDYEQLFNVNFWQQVFFPNGFNLHFLISLIDIVIVWYVIFKLIKIVKDTRIVQILKGLALFFVVRIVSEIVGLTTVTWLMNQVITYGVIACIIIFQPEARLLLEQLGRTTKVFNKKETLTPDARHIEAYEKAVSYMARRKIGALITIEQTQKLSEYTATGIRLDADITAELLINIFIPNTPLHDGAVIVQGDKVTVASAYLPLTENPNISKEFGTRHRAAIGISEVTDALTIIVSEETGEISLTKNGIFIPHLDMKEFADQLNNELLDVGHIGNKSPFFEQFFDLRRKHSDE